MSEKNQIRKDILLKIKENSQDSLSKKSQNIATELCKHSWYIQANSILFYISTYLEVDTTLMIKDALNKNKRLSAPVIDKNSGEFAAYQICNFENDLINGPYDIKEPDTSRMKPVSPEAIDLVVVPGVAFTIDGKRLGRGGGYYDQYLNQPKLKAKSIGLAFDCQIVNDLPMLSHDQEVDRVLFA